MNQDQEHLRLLSIWHYIIGSLTMLSGCASVCVASPILGVPVALLSESDPGGEFFAWTTVGLFGCAIAQVFVIGLAMLVTGSRLTSHTGHGFCFFVACIECLIMPMGTVLGVFTIVVLMRPSVKELFGKNSHTLGHDPFHRFPLSSGRAFV